MERAGEDNSGESGEEERSRAWRDETVEDARSLEGTREAFEATGSNYTAMTGQSQ